MNSQYAKGVTMIDDLPDLDDMEGAETHSFKSAVRTHLRTSAYPGADMLPPGEADRYQKYIRGGHSAPLESGMGPEQQMPSSMVDVSKGVSTNNELITYKMPLNSPSCIDVAEHIQNCPICSKFYNNDKTVYIISIVVLSIICILLLKKVMEL